MKSDNSTIVVILPTFKCRSWIVRSISSILRQRYRNLDLYVIDDAGGDIDKELLTLFPEVTFVRLKKQVGPYYIANVILKLTESAYFAFQDADDESHPDRFVEQLRFMSENSCLGCGSWFTLVDIYGDPLGFEACPENASNALRDGLVANSILHPAALYDRKILSLLTGFDGSVCFAADTEFFLRASLMVKLGNVQKFLYFQTVRPNSLTSDPKTGFFSRARADYVQKILQTYDDIRQKDGPTIKPGRLMSGEKFSSPSLNCISDIRLGTGNSTFRNYGKKYAGKL